MRFSLGGILPPVFSLHSQAGLLWAPPGIRPATGRGTGLSPSVGPRFQRVPPPRHRGWPVAPYPTLHRPPGEAGFRAGLMRVHSQLLAQSQLISGTPLIYMLKFRGLSGAVQSELSLMKGSGPLGEGWIEGVLRRSFGPPAPPCPGRPLDPQVSR